MQLDAAIEHNSYVENVGEAYMSHAQQAHFKQVLLDWKKAITENNGDALDKLQADTSPLADLNDRASLEEEFALSLRSRDRERKLLKKINAALERIANDEFGYCESCGVEIGLPRLSARPTAELCIDCKQLQEKKEIRVREAR